MGQMEEIIGRRPFNMVGLPGTHDSGTYVYNEELGAAPDSELTTKIDDILGSVDALSGLSDFVLGHVFARLCQTQTLNFTRQLEEGIRYFDVRIARHEETNTFHTCHGVYCAEVSDILNQVKGFLDNNSKVS